MYNPNCAFACRGAIASAMLSCSDMAAMGGMTHHGGSAMTTAECRANDTSFLTTLAWCMSSTCAEYKVETWKLEKYWLDKTTGEPEVMPKWGYTETLGKIKEAPKAEWNEEDTLNFTALVAHEAWDTQRLTMANFELAETLHSRYGIITLKIKPYIIYPSLIGTYNVRPLPYLSGNAPAVGQTIFIVLLLILNVAFMSIGYRTSYPSNAWFSSTWQERMGYVTNRTGVLAFALAPLVILFSGRNNILLWLTNWSHSTYMLLHRWVARLFALQVIVHSITELVLYQNKGEYEIELKQPYWIWGAVATAATCIMLIASHLYFRHASYEVFLIIHIVLAVFVIAGSWYHVELLFTRKWGYELWLYAACAVWFFDRLIRVLRIAKVGIRRANVTEIGPGYARVDLESVRWAITPGYHAYAYFPTLAPLKPWENHPFSIIPTSMLRSRNRSIVGLDSGRPSEDHDVEKSKPISATTAPVQVLTTTAGISVYIKKSKGATRLLKNHENLLTLLDGPYPSTPCGAVLKCDRLLLIGGGIGITGLLSWVNCHLNVKLCWSVKQTAACVVRDLDSVLTGIAEKDVRIGQRLDIHTLLEEEIQAGWKKIGVVVCGPGGLCDDTRAAVSKAGRQRKAVFELEVDAFSW
ncbi:ferric reductase transmembrane component 4 [Halenospora varia]|nr:ferric reductase transmembrane component 4 [Halenospora varia]